MASTSVAASESGIQRRTRDIEARRVACRRGVQRRAAGPQCRRRRGAQARRDGSMTSVTHGTLGARRRRGSGGQAARCASTDRGAPSGVVLAVHVRRERSSSSRRSGSRQPCFLTSSRRALPGRRQPAAPAARRTSARRPREIRDITVPIGTSSTVAISAYESSSTSRSQTAWRKASGSASSAACRSASSVGARQHLLRRLRPRGVVNRPLDRLAVDVDRVAAVVAAVLRNVLWRIVNSHALRLVPASN